MLLFNTLKNKADVNISWVPDSMTDAAPRQRDTYMLFPYM